MSESPGTVFAIDDDVLIQHALGRLIRSIGLQVECFGLAREFLNRKPPEMPACMTLDVRLPEISGLDFQRRLAEAHIRILPIFDMEPY
jgi:FixJ family two-component response regulator